MGCLLSQLLQQLRQGPQAIGMKHRAPGGYLAKRVAFHQVRPDRWNLLQITAWVLKEQGAVNGCPLLLDQLKLSVSERMERVGDSEPARSICRNECIRWGTRRGDRTPSADG